MDDLKSLIMGSILGDGSLRKITKKNSSLGYGHCDKQLEYLRWKVSILEKYGLHTGRIKEYIHKSDRYKSGQCITHHTVSRQNAIFTYYRNMFYPEGKKIINFLCIDLTPLALAIWFMDDGQKCTSSYQINTQSFSRTELDFMIVYLKNKFDLDFTIDKLNVLYLRAKDRTKFENIIRPYLHPTMVYKLRVLNKLDELREQPEVVNPEPSISLNV